MTEFEQEQMRTAIGPEADYYLTQFEKIERDGSKWVATWNWPAFFLSSAWLAYRRMNHWSLLNFFLPILFAVLMIAANQLGLLIMAAYLALAFVVVPLYANAFYYRHLMAQLARAAASADAKAAEKFARPPSFATGIEAALTAVLAFAIPLFLLIVPGLYDDYAPRAKVSQGVSLATSLQQPISDFYLENKRLPAPQEAGKFRIDGGNYTQSVVYDAEKRMIVVTMGQKNHKDYLYGKRLAIHAEEKDGAISWTCRTIDLERRYLPAVCRN